MITKTLSRYFAMRFLVSVIGSFFGVVALAALSRLALAAVGPMVASNVQPCQAAHTLSPNPVPPAALAGTCRATKGRISGLARDSLVPAELYNPGKKSIAKKAKCCSE
jgi:hypothetical protein